MGEQIICRNVIVSGRVQGVWFRATTQEQALLLGVAGWVKNRGDGSVELLVQGTVEAVEQLQEWLYEGPPLARVDQLKVDELLVEETLQGFEII